MRNSGCYIKATSAVFYANEYFSQYSSKVSINEELVFFSPLEYW